MGCRVWYGVNAMGCVDVDAVVSCVALCYANAKGKEIGETEQANP
jgi:hypothetical protein